MTEEHVNHPAHYNMTEIECILVVRHLNFDLGNAVKYVWRAGAKGNREQDLRKALWYLEDEVRRMNKGMAPMPGLTAEVNELFSAHIATVLDEYEAEALDWMRRATQRSSYMTYIDDLRHARHWITNALDAPRLGTSIEEALRD